MRWPAGDKGVALTVFAVVVGYLLVRWFLERQLRPGSFTDKYARGMWV